ncbi:MAG TPA: BRO family protein [Metalysinibacillus sp.]
MELQVIHEQTLFGQSFKVYGSFEEPLFLAKDVANWIEHTDLSRMVELVDDEEKLKRTLYVSGQSRHMWFLTEDGLYEVLMQSRKPIAKAFKKEVKVVLRNIRKQGYHVTQEGLPPQLWEEINARVKAKQQIFVLAGVTSKKALLKALEHEEAECHIDLSAFKESVNEVLLSQIGRTSDFFEDCCRIDWSEKTKTTDLYMRYLYWSGTKQIQPLGNRSFYHQIEMMGFVKKRGNGNHLYFGGIALIKE